MLQQPLLPYSPNTLARYCIAMLQVNSPPCEKLNTFKAQVSICESNTATGFWLLSLTHPSKTNQEPKTKPTAKHTKYKKKNQHTQALVTQCQPSPSWHNHRRLQKNQKVKALRIVLFPRKAVPTHVAFLLSESRKDFPVLVQVLATHTTTPLRILRAPFFKCVKSVIKKAQPTEQNQKAF